MSRAAISSLQGAAACQGAACADNGKAGHNPQQAPAGTLLCRRCLHILTTQLASLPALYDECGRRLDGAARPHPRVSGGPLPGLPFNTAASEARAAILGVLGSWAGMVAQERRVTPPARTAAGLAAFLGRHVSWLAAHSAAAEITDEVARLVRTARSVAYPEPLRRVQIGVCVEAECGGELVALVRQGRPLAAAEITCEADPEHRWTDRQWLQLSRRMRDRAVRDTGRGAVPTRWLSADDVSRLWRIASGSVYRLASERQWRRRAHAGRTYYHEADVQRTLAGRDAGSIAG